MPLRDYLADIAIPALVTAVEDRQLLRGIGDQLDQLAQRARDSAQAALLYLCGDDAVAAHGVNFRLERLGAETAGRHRQVLKDRYLHRRSQGTDEELITQLARLDCPASVTMWIDLALGGNPGAFGGTFTSFGYITIDMPNPFGDGFVWDDVTQTWEAPAEFWDLADTQNRLQDVKRLIAQWKDASVSFRWVDIVTPAGTTRVPLRELWEYDQAGGAPDRYNTGY